MDIFEAISKMNKEEKETFYSSIVYKRGHKNAFLHLLDRGGDTAMAAVCEGMEQGAEKFWRAEMTNMTPMSDEELSHISEILAASFTEVGAIMSNIKKHTDDINSNMQTYRDIMRGYDDSVYDYESDQSKGMEMPPYQRPHDKDAMTIKLPSSENAQLKEDDVRRCIGNRESRRAYTDEPVTLEELSYLLWATQGIRGRKGKYQFRMVPSGGARQPFETYLAVNNVAGLEQGIYRYLPEDHSIVFVKRCADQVGELSSASLDQHFVGESAVCFIWTAVPYRTEWRYGPTSHKCILVEAGHVCQNLYLAAESIGCGTCAILAYSQDDLDRFIGVDGKEEMSVYLSPVGKVK